MPTVRKAKGEKRITIAPVLTNHGHWEDPPSVISLEPEMFLLRGDPDVTTTIEEGDEEPTPVEGLEDQDFDFETLVTKSKTTVIKRRKTKTPKTKKPKKTSVPVAPDQTTAAEDATITAPVSSDNVLTDPSIPQSVPTSFVPTTSPNSFVPTSLATPGTTTEVDGGQSNADAGPEYSSEKTNMAILVGVLSAVALLVVGIAVGIWLLRKGGVAAKKKRQQQEETTAAAGAAEGRGSGGSGKVGVVGVRIIEAVPPGSAGLSANALALESPASINGSVRSDGSRAGSHIMVIGAGAGTNEQASIVSSNSGASVHSHLDIPAETLGGLGPSAAAVGATAIGGSGGNSLYSAYSSQASAGAFKDAKTAEVATTDSMNRMANAAPLTDALSRQPSVLEKWMPGFLRGNSKKEDDDIEAGTPVKRGAAAAAVAGVGAAAAGIWYKLSGRGKSDTTKDIETDFPDDAELEDADDDDKDESSAGEAASDDAASTESAAARRAEKRSSVASTASSIIGTPPRAPRSEPRRMAPGMSSPGSSGTSPGSSKGFSDAEALKMVETGSLQAVEMAAGKKQKKKDDKKKKKSKKSKSGYSYLPAEDADVLQNLANDEGIDLGVSSSSSAAATGIYPTPSASPFRQEKTAGVTSTSTPASQQAFRSAQSSIRASPRPLPAIPASEATMIDTLQPLTLELASPLVMTPGTQTSYQTPQSGGSDDEGSDLSIGRAALNAVPFAVRSLGGSTKSNSPPSTPGGDSGTITPDLQGSLVAGASRRSSLYSSTPSEQPIPPVRTMASGVGLSAMSTPSRMGGVGVVGVRQLGTPRSMGSVGIIGMAGGASSPSRSIGSNASSGSANAGGSMRTVEEHLAVAYAEVTAQVDARRAKEEKEEKERLERAEAEKETKRRKVPPSPEEAQGAIALLGRRSLVVPPVETASISDAADNQDDTVSMKKSKKKKKNRELTVLPSAPSPDAASEDRSEDNQEKEAKLPTLSIAAANLSQDSINAAAEGALDSARPASTLSGMSNSRRESLGNAPPLAIITSARSSVSSLMPPVLEAPRSEASQAAAEGSEKVSFALPSPKAFSPFSESLSLPVLSWDDVSRQSESEAGAVTVSRDGDSPAAATSSDKLSSGEPGSPKPSTVQTTTTGGSESLMRKAEVYARASRTIGAVRKAVAAYEAELSDEMEVEVGDPILIESVFRDGWATGWNYRSQARGAFPLESVISLAFLGPRPFDARSINSVIDDLRNKSSPLDVGSIMSKRSDARDSNSQTSAPETVKRESLPIIPRDLPAAEEGDQGRLSTSVRFDSLSRSQSKIVNINIMATLRDDRNVDERSSIARISKLGHGDILSHGPNGLTSAEQHLTTSRATFTSHPIKPATTGLRHGPGAASVIGKRRALIEADLMKRAMEELEEPTVDRSAKEWVSTAHSDFCQGKVGDPKRLQKKSCYVGVSGPQYGWDVPQPHQNLKHLEHPITFWSDHATKGSGTVICSSKPEELGATGGVRFGKHAAFSTPIKEYLKGEVKDQRVPKAGLDAAKTAVDAAVEMVERLRLQEKPIGDTTIKDLDTLAVYWEPKTFERTGLSEQQLCRVQRLVSIFHGVDAIFDSTESAIQYFSDPSKGPHHEFNILKWELVSLCFVAELCISYEEAAISTGKRLVKQNPALLERLGRDARSQWEAFQAKRKRGKDKKRSSGVDVGDASEGESGGDANDGRRAGKRLVVLPVRFKDEEGLWRWRTVGKLPAATFDSIKTDKEDHAEALIAEGDTKSSKNMRDSLLLASKKFTENNGTTPNSKIQTDLLAATSPPTSRSPSTGKARAIQMETKCVLVDEQDLEENPVLAIFCDHGDVLAQLWHAYKMAEEDQSAETIHDLLESLTLPPAVAVGSSSEEASGTFGDVMLKKSILRRYISLSSWGEHSNEISGRPYERKDLEKLFAKRLFTIHKPLPRDADEVLEEDRMMISFVIWMCVMRVHGERLNEEERRNHEMWFCTNDLEDSRML
ncbi:hypothetical protein HDU97_002389 [Phlyctochytrium planicorne]|nr:hypothetical protein HDU97_002389 [Phlyctochytrium planicorne]